MSKIKLSLLSWLMFPVYAWQGIKIRNTIQRLLPANIPHEGKIGDGNAPVKILCMGDSTFASLGMSRIEDSLAYNIANAVYERTNQSVTWRSIGANSATSAEIRDYIVPHIESRDYTHIIIAIGTNDVKNFHSVPRFKKSFGTLLYAVKARFADAQIIWTPVADMTKFPSLPKGLATVLGYRAQLINAQGKQLCEERGANYTPPVPIKSDQGFASDGFHAGPAGYQTWGQHLADYITVKK